MGLHQSLNPEWSLQSHNRSLHVPHSERADWISGNVPRCSMGGEMLTGGGHSNLEGNMRVLGIPIMAKNFIQTECCIREWWKQQLQESMKEAGREEKALAEERSRGAGNHCYCR